MKPWLWAAILVAGVAHAQTDWKLATGYRAESFHTRNLVQFAQDVELATQGRLRTEVVPNNGLYRLAEIPGAVQAGKAQGGEVIMNNLVKDMPIAGADSVPFVVGSYADAKRMWQYQRPLVESHFAQLGMKVLYAAAWPPQGLHSRKPISGLADSAITGMRTYNLSTVRIAELLHAQPVDVPMVDVGKALAEGRMDNMVTSAVTVVENKVWGDIKYFYEINAGFPKNIVFVNLKAFDALPPASQKALMEAAGRAEQRRWEMSQQAASDALAEFRAHGVKIERIPRELEGEIQRMGEKFSREWVRSVGNEANSIFIPYYVKQVL